MASRGVDEIYPSSTHSDHQVLRSRTWNEHMTKEWNAPIIAAETLEDALERYCKYFSLTDEQLRALMTSMMAEMRKGMRLHAENPRAPHDPLLCSLPMGDTCVKALPTGNEKGVACVVELAGPDVTRARALRVQLDGHGKFSTKCATVDLTEAAAFPKGALDAKATATVLFDSLAQTVKQLKETEKLPVEKGKDLPVALSVGLLMHQQSPKSAVLTRWQKAFETGRLTDDPVEGMDLGALLNCALRRKKVEAHTACVVNDAVGLLLAGAYSNLTPPCRIALSLGSGIDGGFVMNKTEADDLRYEGIVVQCGLGSFDADLPLNDIDLEIDFAQSATRGSSAFEKMIAADHVAEICRRAILKVWQNDAPELSWVRCSMPWQACVKIVMDDSEGLKTSEEILKVLWDWATGIQERKTVKRLFGVVFDRAAALSAVSVASLAKMSDRLQPAMGGISCAVDGILYAEIPFFDGKIRHYLNVLLGEDTSKLISFHVVREGHAVGAAAYLKDENN